MVCVNVYYYVMVTEDTEMNAEVIVQTFDQV